LELRLPPLPAIFLLSDRRPMMRQTPAVRPRKVAFVFTSMPVGGAEDFALGVGPHLGPAYEAHYVCLRELGRLGEEAEAAGRNIHCVPVFSSRWITPWAVRNFAAWLREQNISLVHSQTHHAHVFATKAAGRAGIPSVVHQQKTLEKLPLRRSAILRACLRRASRVVALSQRTAEDLCRAYSLPADRVSVVPNGIEKSIFKPCEEKSGLRRSLGLPAEGLLVGMVGRLHEEKNHGTMIRAVAEARRQGAFVNAVFVGEGNLRDQLDKQARESGVSDAFIFAGARRPIVPWLQAFDVFVLPSVWEGQPLALLQAIACGIPVLASNIEGNTAVLGDEHPGLFSPSDHARLARLLATASRDAVFLQQVQDFQIKVEVPWAEKSAQKLAAVYNLLLS
jgi:glycosyltransferase involved in cell wall biosynthesis